MIPAKHNRQADFIFSIYIRWMFRRRFNTFNLIGSPPEINSDLPLIITPNHSTWWDGFFLWFINKYFFKRKYYIMMLEDQLRNFPFFAKLGAFSIMQNNPKKILETINYSADILIRDKRSILVMFPQGEMHPDFERPINAFQGIRKIIEKYGSELNVLTLGVKSCFLEEELPHVFYRFGKNHIVSKESNINAGDLANEIQYNLDMIESSIIDGNKGTIIFYGKHSVSKKYQEKR